MRTRNSVIVTYRPRIAGNLSSSLVITDNAPGSPQKLALAGTAGSPTLSVSPPSLSYGTVWVLLGSATQNVVVKNTGIGLVAFTGSKITGANAGDFSQSNN